MVDLAVIWRVMVAVAVCQYLLMGLGGIGREFGGGGGGVGI